MDIDRKQILQTFLSTIDHLSDKDYQKRIWIRCEGPEVDSFDDVVNYFSMEGDGIIDCYKDFDLSEAQCEILKNFREKFKAFYDENDFPEEFVDTPEWAEVMDMAKEVLKAFSYSNNSQAE